MNDEETAALIIGGHTFGKCHGMGGSEYIGPEPEGCPVDHQGIGWKNTFGSGKGGDALTSGLEGAWTNNPIQWDNGYLENLFGYEWELTTSPAGAKQWTPTDASAKDKVPDAHDPSKRHAPIMLTSDIALRVDPIYEPIARRFYENPDQLSDAFARAWYKLLHRDMGPLSRYLGPWVAEAQLWQDPVPAADGTSSVTPTSPPSRRRSSPPACRSGSWWPRRGRRRRRSAAPTSGAAPTVPASAWPRRRTGRPTTRPQLATVLSKLEQIQQDFNGKSGGAKVSLADLIVLGGVRRRREGGQGRRPRRHGAVRAGPHRRDAGADRRRVVRGARADRRRVPQLPRRRRQAAAGAAVPRPGQPARPDGARDDGARRRPAGPRRQPRRHRATASSPTGPVS